MLLGLVVLGFLGGATGALGSDLKIELKLDGHVT